MFREVLLDKKSDRERDYIFDSIDQEKSSLLFANHDVIQGTISHLIDSLSMKKLRLSDTKIALLKNLEFYDFPNLHIWGEYKRGKILLHPLSQFMPDVITHEVLHALSDNGHSVGFSLRETKNFDLISEKNNSPDRFQGDGLNEGATQLLANLLIQYYPQEFFGDAKILSTNYQDNILKKNKEKNIKKFVKQFTSPKGFFKKVGENFDMKKYSSHDYYLSLRNFSGASRKFYTHEVMLVQSIIVYLEKKGYTENDFWNAYFSSDHEFLENALGEVFYNQVIDISRYSRYDRDNTTVMYFLTKIFNPKTSFVI